MLPLPVLYDDADDTIGGHFGQPRTTRAGPERLRIGPMRQAPRTPPRCRPQLLLFTQRYEGPVRSCRSKREEQAHITRSRTAKILIANLELELELTCRKLSPLGISNRKFSPLLRLRFSSPPRSTSANETSDTRHSSLCVLIHGSAIKSRRKPFENSNLQISNRRQTGPRCGAKVQKSRQDAGATREQNLACRARTLRLPSGRSGALTWHFVGGEPNQRLPVSPMNTSGRKKRGKPALQMHAPILTASSGMRSGRTFLLASGSSGTAGCKNSAAR